MGTYSKCKRWTVKRLIIFYKLNLGPIHKSLFFLYYLVCRSKIKEFIDYRRLAAAVAGYQQSFVPPAFSMFSINLWPVEDCWTLRVILPAAALLSL